jgi:hypothetical protein
MRTIAGKDVDRCLCQNTHVVALRLKLEGALVPGVAAAHFTIFGHAWRPTDRPTARTDVKLIP